MKSILFLSAIIVLTHGFSMDFLSAASSLESASGMLSNLAPNKLEKHECGENVQIPINNITAIPFLQQGEMIWFYSKNQGNYPANYNCGAFFVGTGTGKSKIKCEHTGIAPGDYMIIIANDFQKVYSNATGLRIYKEFRVPVFYVGFVSNNGGARGFYCRVYG